MAAYKVLHRTNLVLVVVAREVSMMDTKQKTAMWRLFDGLQGVWKLERRWGVRGYMQGFASFQPRAQGVLYYQELGWATFGNGKVLRASRAYAYVYDRGTVAVHFWDPERRRPAGLLHTLRLYAYCATSQRLVATGAHRCAADTYVARYVFVTPERFRLTYQVLGPRKRYTIVSHCSKTTDAPAADACL